MARKKKSNSNKTSGGSNRPGQGPERGANLQSPGQYSSQPPRDSIKSPKEAGSSNEATAGPSQDQPERLISRNRNWQHVSAFHGQWLTRNLAGLEAMSHTNINSIRPPAVVPAVWFDLVKIRRLVNEATQLAVDAAAHGTFEPQGRRGGRPSSGPSPRLRQLWREKACQKLASAYRLDEIACSVACTQGSSALDDVAQLVLRQKPDDPDAKYIHFFHEKVSSPNIAEHTSLALLREIMRLRPSWIELLRTIATVKIFKADFRGAIRDLDHALSQLRLSPPSEPPASGHSREQSGDSTLTYEAASDADQQPTNLEMQLLFLKANANLSLACHHIPLALSSSPVSGGDLATPDQDASSPSGDASTAQGQGGNSSKTRPGKTAETDRGSDAAMPEPIKERAWHRKVVRAHAMRALSDYTAFLSRVDYAPCVPNEVFSDFASRAVLCVQRGKPIRATRPDELPEYAVYHLSQLFAPKPPPDLPAFPPRISASSEDAQTKASASQSAVGDEVISYHPLLTEVIHSLLLCHSILQTPPDELRRLACMVARITRLRQGYNFIQPPSYCTAQSDWIEVLRHGDNWIRLPWSWDQLCDPHYLLNVSRNDQFPLDAAERQLRDMIRHQAIADSMFDDDVRDLETLKSAIQAREANVEERAGLFQATSSQPDRETQPVATQGSEAFAPSPVPMPSQWSPDQEQQELSLVHSRAHAVGRWVSEAPLGTGKPKKKKKRKKQQQQQPDGGATTGQKAEGDETQDGAVAISSEMLKEVMDELALNDEMSGV